MPPQLLPELQTDTNSFLNSIRDTAREIKKLPPDYDFLPLTFISHASDYAKDPPRLRRYAGQVINARIEQFGRIQLYKTHYFLEAFLGGYTLRNIYQMFFAARALIEIYAVTRDVYTTIAQHGGDHEDGFAERVKAIDEVLINGTYGTRSDIIKKHFPQYRRFEAA
jgi:hypothetical protein